MWIENPAPAGKAAPPTVELDPEWDFAVIPIVAAMTWPRSKRRQSEATATFAAQMMGFVEAVTPEVAVQGLRDSIAHVAERLGVAPAEVLSMPHTRELVSEAMPIWPQLQAEFRGRIEQELFRSAGGFHSVASAPGSARLTSDINKVFNGGAFACGTRLLMVARLAKFHPNLSASLNRADAILEIMKDNWAGAKLPADRTLKYAWKEWGGVAPLWAAYVGTLEDAVLNSVGPQEWALRMRMDKPMRRQLIGWAKWFRRFAVGHVPKGATRTLLAEQEAVLITGAVPEMEPPMGPLSDDQYRAAAAYRAPKAMW